MSHHTEQEQNTQYKHTVKKEKKAHDVRNRHREL